MQHKVRYLVLTTMMAMWATSGFAQSDPSFESTAAYQVGSIRAAANRMVRVDVLNSSGRTQICSGILVAKGVAMVPEFCTQDAVEVQLVHNFEGSEDQVQRASAQLVDAPASGGLVAINTDLAFDPSPIPVRLARSGEAAVLMGFPFGRQLVLTRRACLVSAVEDEASVFHTCASEIGMAGGALMAADDGAVIGIQIGPRQDGRNEATSLVGLIAP